MFLRKVSALDLFSRLVSPSALRWLGHMQVEVVWQQCDGKRLTTVGLMTDSTVLLSIYRHSCLRTIQNFARSGANRAREAMKSKHRTVYLLPN